MTNKSLLNDDNETLSKLKSQTAVPNEQSILLSLLIIERSKLIRQLNSCIWMVAAYKRSISNLKTVLNFCNKMGYGRVTKLMHALRNSSIVHQRVIHESYLPNKRAIEFERLGFIEII